ncbi:MAG: hypothetical protein PHY94_04620, partial [Candidatus Omnitrophica bacterium]|nr:hypothetical protein [Candidatus Omnitrophota bacterium]
MNSKPISYPKVLIFSPQPFNYLTGFGITVSNLFKNWPGDCLACAYTQDMVADDSVCRNHFRIKMNRLRFIAMGRRVIADDFKAWLEDFHPQIIYCAPNSLNDLVYILIIHSLCRAKLVVHMLDDWPARLRFEDIASRIATGWNTGYYLKQLFKRASLRIAIGNELCDAYKEKYGLEFVHFQNCPESELWIRNGKNSREYRDSLRLIFTGAIYNPGNLQTLLQLSQAIGKLNRKGVNLKLDIYTTA